MKKPRKTRPPVRRKPTKEQKKLAVLPPVESLRLLATEPPTARAAGGLGVAGIDPADMEGP